MKNQLKRAEIGSKWAERGQKWLKMVKNEPKEAKSGQNGVKSV